MHPWWEVYDGRYDEEISALEAAGLCPSIDEAEKQAGRLVVRVQYKDKEEGRLFHITVVFPDNYPFAPFFAFADKEFPKGKHLHPSSFHLCLLHNMADKWNRDEDLAAAVIQEKLPEILHCHRHPEDAERFEPNAGVPAAGYYDYLIDSVILTADSNVPDGVQAGILEVGCVALNIEADGELVTQDSVAFKGVVERILDSEMNTIIEIDPMISERFLGKGKQIERVPWVRLDTPPPYNLRELYDFMKQHFSLLQPPGSKGTKKSKAAFRHPKTFAYLYPVETRRGVTEPTWLFIKISPYQQLGQIKHKVALIRCDHVDRNNYLARAGILGPLANKRVAVVGVGAIGSGMLMQLAKAGVGDLRIIDGDFLTSANLVRWAGGLNMVGGNKAKELKKLIEQFSPFVKVSHHPFNIGWTHPDPDFHRIMRDSFARALDGVDMVIDTSVCWTANDWLSDWTKKAGIPYVWAVGTPGGYGGIVGRVIPGQTEGCYQCYRYWQRDKSSQSHIRRPAIDPRDDQTIQPTGCNEPTFTGTGMDMDYIGLACARLAVASLCRGEPGGHPDFDWVVGVVDLWNESTNTPIEPKWSRYTLHRHPDCACHG